MSTVEAGGEEVAFDEGLDGIEGARNERKVYKCREEVGGCCGNVSEGGRGCGRMEGRIG